jgi:hypothetical protein
MKAFPQMLEVTGDFLLRPVDGGRDLQCGERAFREEGSDPVPDRPGFFGGNRRFPGTGHYSFTRTAARVHRMDRSIFLQASAPLHHKPDVSILMSPDNSSWFSALKTCAID